MAFSVPTFNLVCKIYTGPWPGVLRLSPFCNLATGRRVVWWGNGGNDSPTTLYGATPLLLVPPLTDIRDSSCGPTPDFVEVPALSGRWYVVQMVDDVGKGFPNEYRLATIGKIFQGVNGSLDYPGLFWPTPIP
jgi:hypothetical protein